MILCDTGPLVAIIDTSDADHERCVTAMQSRRNEPVLTTWCCLTELMHFARGVGGHPAQERVWDFIAQGALLLDFPPPDEWRRIRALMDEYSDQPMDLADASLVAAAERLGSNRIFTLDRHFYAYRIHGTGTFDVIPG